MTKTCKHGRPVCSECVVVTDAARRFADGVNAICAFTKLEDRSHKWLAITLADGSVDSSLYPSKAQAIAHQSNEFHHAYICMDGVQGGLSPRDAQLWLDLHRHIYDNGGRLTDPHRDIIMPLGRDQKITRA